MAIHTRDVLIKDIHFSSPVQLTAVYKALNDTVRPYSEQTTLHQLINEQVQRTPDKIALVWGSTQVTYRDLNRRANQFAGYLLDKGVKPGGTVGVCVKRTPDMVIALLAIMKCGAAYVPLDPSYPKERLEFMLSDSASTVLITSDQLTTIATVGATILYVEELLTALPNLPDQEPDVPVLSTDLLYVLYTSGSTGKPKGVQITHHNLINLLLSMQEEPGISANDRLLAISTISFDIAGLELFLPLISGASLVLADTLTAKDGKALLQLIELEQITFVQATPSTWRMLGDAGWVGKLPIKALCGGEALSRELAADLIAKCDSLWNVYGPTETTVWSSVKQISSTDGAITIGRPIANTQMYILDEYLRPVDVGIVGELFIGGKGVARGYLSRPELTAERFLADPFANQTGVRMYRTGDLGKLLGNGDIQCLGRVDYQIKVRGYRIELGEIENALTALDTVRDSVVAAQVSPSGDQRLIAYVVPAAGTPVETASYISEWKRTLRNQLPNYMVPSDFRLLTTMPLLPNGKIDRSALASLTTNVPGPPKGCSGPRTSGEKIVSDIWKDCLKLEAVNVFENFFEVGGHSIIAVQIMVRLKKETGKQLPLAALFEHSTVEKLALLLEMDGKSVTWDPLVPIKPLGSKVPLYIVHGAGLHVLLFNTLAKNMDPDQPIYGLQAKGINSVEEPLTTIEEIAAYYISAITAKNPDGPYALAGYSFGGIIAYEMHKQFSAMGRTITLLAMFDTYAYQSDYYDSLLTKCVNRARFVINRTLFSFKALRKAPQKVFRHNMHAIASRLAKLYWRIKDGEEKQQARFSRHYYKLDSVNSEASLRYRLTPQHVVVDLFRAKENSHYTDDFEYLGWKPFALKGVRTHDVPGDHMNMFSPPNDVEFARTLQKALDTRSLVRT